VKRHLDPGRAAPAVEPRRYHPCVVGDQQVARAQQVGQFGDAAVDHLIALANNRGGKDNITALVVEID
jgi:hypothetical protein